jgi:uncharacterized protein YbaR (Trm112 family)
MQTNKFMTKAEELSKELLDLICCPIDKKDLKYNKKKQTLTCTYCMYIYPVKEGIPILLPPELQENNPHTPKNWKHPDSKR